MLSPSLLSALLLYLQLSGDPSSQHSAHAMWNPAEAISVLQTEHYHPSLMGCALDTEVEN